MKTQILLIAMISLSVHALTATNPCDCTEIIQSADCKGGCTWSTANSSCAAKTVDCTTYTTQPTCDSYATCAWSDATSKCATFTACADYSVSVPDQCYYKNSTCVPGTTGTDGKTPCKTGSITCTSFTNAADCNGKSPSDSTLCWFKANACAQFDVSKCSVVTEKEICECSEGLCKWTTDSKCAAYACADMPDANSCVTVMLDDLSGVNICSFDTTTSKCADATLTSANCFDKTFGFIFGMEVPVQNVQDLAATDTFQLLLDSSSCLCSDSVFKYQIINQLLFKYFIINLINIQYIQIILLYINKRRDDLNEYNL